MNTVENINRDVQKLHPQMRDAAAAVLQDLHSRGFTFEIFEGYRSPERQEWLYEQGRTRPGRVVTKAKPGQSYHQYGLAADFVPKINGQWSWDVPDEWWQELHRAGRLHLLEPLTFEAPHLQMSGLKLADLQAGHLPPLDSKETA